MAKPKKLYKVTYAKTLFKLVVVKAYTEAEAWELADRAKENNDPRMFDELTVKDEQSIVWSDCDCEAIEDYPKEFDGLEQYVKEAMTLRSNPPTPDGSK